MKSVQVNALNFLSHYVNKEIHEFFFLSSRTTAHFTHTPFWHYLNGFGYFQMNQMTIFKAHEFYVNKGIHGFFSKFTHHCSFDGHHVLNIWSKKFAKKRLRTKLFMVYIRIAICYNNYSGLIKPNTNGFKSFLLQLSFVNVAEM